MNQQELPVDEDLNIEALSRIFDDTTNSYKILFFRSILRFIREDKISEIGEIQLSDLAVDVLASAWPLTQFYRLSLGSRDQIGELLSTVEFEFSRANRAAAVFSSQLSDQIKKNIDAPSLEKLNRYVPFRLLRPFFEYETRGLADTYVNRKIYICANAAFESAKPCPYKIVLDAASKIVLHEQWLKYFSKHLKILWDWADFQLMSYLQRRNPNAPAIGSKLYLPTARESLSWQASVWKPLFGKQTVRCIYSNEVLAFERIHLDHFLPWSFVCHNEPWNLIPVHPAANSSKGSRIPASTYLPAFVDLQARCLAAAHDTVSTKAWDKICSSYAAGLRVEESDFFREKSLYSSFEETVLPLASIARRMGFSSDWVFRTVDS